MYRHEEPHGIDFGSYPKSDSYWPKRITAHLIDLLIYGLISVILVLLISSAVGLSVLITLIIILALTGILVFLMNSIFDAVKGASIGKQITHLRVIGEKEEISASQAFGRNVLHIIPVIGPILNWLIGLSSEDDRQVWLDSLSTTLVIEDISEVRESPVYSYAPPPPPKPKEKISLGFPGKAMTGNCPRCGAPYRILPREDRSWSGLWNYRCTWCNYKIFEDMER